MKCPLGCFCPEDRILWSGPVLCQIRWGETSKSGVVDRCNPGSRRLGCGRPLGAGFGKVQGNPAMIVLGIETSCDETAAAVVTEDGAILSNVLYSQLEEHAPYGGVVPEIAARAHLDIIEDIVSKALQKSSVSLDRIDAVAAAAGPGLIGGLIIGVTAGKAIALARGIPFVAVNHLEAHALTVRLTDNVPFPFLLLLVSGGHCQLLSVQGPGSYRPLGTTLDDAVGEAFDKTARLLGLGMPGGPAIEQAAGSGDPQRFGLPRPLRGRPGCDFSFSGLKTAVRHLVVHSLDSPLTDQDRADICASFQEAVADVVAERCDHALTAFSKIHDDLDQGQRNLVVAGGVAANMRLRERLVQICRRHHFALAAPPPALCTDNGVMIAWAAIERLRQGRVDGLDFAPRPRWPLETL